MVSEERKKELESMLEKPSINHANQNIKLHNLKKDLDNYPDLHDIIKNNPENNDKNIKKMEVNFGEDSKTQVIFYFFFFFSKNF